MVRGLDRFKAHFAGYADRYVLIGGTACSVAMEEAGLDFRATKDLDIVLCVEALDKEFVDAFWDFVRAGRYNNRQKSTGRKLFYRFYDPEDETFPFMLELFSRQPDSLSLKDDSHLTPIPMNEEASSLSAILLNEDYYRFIHGGKREINGLSVLGPEYLIPLKARAWLDMIARQATGESVDGKDIRKHKNDVFRLYRIIDPMATISLPDSLGDDLRRFIESVTTEALVDLKALGFRNTNLEEILGQIARIYGIGHRG
jgi:hypothetical protein